MYCKNQINTVIWWRSTKFRQKSSILLSLATKREIWKSESIEWKKTEMRSYSYRNFEDLTIHVTEATDAKFWGSKFQNEFTHAKLRGRDPIFRYCPIIRTCSFIWASQNKFSTTPCKSPVLFRPSANTVFSTFLSRFIFSCLVYLVNCKLHLNLMVYFRRMGLTPISWLLNYLLADWD